MNEKAPKPQHIAAFKEKLISHTEHGRKTKAGVLLQPESRSDVVVRALEWERATELGFFRPSGVEDISAEDYARITKQHFDELSAYGIESPVQFVVAQRDKQATSEDKQKEVYAIVENIHKAENTNLADMGKEYSRVRSALLKYYTEKFESSSSYLADLWKDTNFVYGKKDGDTHAALYLVDIDPYIYQDNRNLYKIMLDMLDEVEKESAHFKNPPEYLEIQKGCKKLLEDISKALKQK